MLAVMVALCDALTATAVAVNVALLALAATATVAGTVTAESLLARLTALPPVPAAALSVTEQLSVPAPVIDALLHVSALTVGCAGGGLVTTAVPVPLNGTVKLPPVELLTSVSDPAAVPTAVGLNCKVKDKVPAPGMVRGRALLLVSEKYCPATPTCVSCTASALSFLRETVPLADWPTVTLPNERDVADNTSVPVVVAEFSAILPQPISAVATKHATSAIAQP